MRFVSRLLADYALRNFGEHVKLILHPEDIRIRNGENILP